MAEVQGYNLPIHCFVNDSFPCASLVTTAKAIVKRTKCTVCIFDKASRFVVVPCDWYQFHSQWIML